MCAETTTDHVDDRIQKHKYRPIAFLIPLSVFIASVAGPAILIGVAIALTSTEYVMSHLYFYGTCGQILMDFLPVFLLIRSRQKWPSSRRNQVKGIIVGLAGAAVLAAVRYAVKGRLIFMEQVPAFGQSLALPFPWNMLSAVLAVLAYGPGEALFMVYLIRAFDEAAGHQQRLMSWGVILNALLWGLPHIGNAIFFGWSAIGNAIFMVVIGTIIGLMQKGTRSALAPIIFWTLINGTSA